MDLSDQSDNAYFQQHEALLLGHPVFANFSQEQIQTLLAQASVLTYSPGSVITHEEKLIDAIYFILKGCCEVRKHVVNVDGVSNEQPVAILIAGESIGLSDVGLYSSTGARSASVVALTQVTVLRLSIESFRHFLKDQPNSDQDMAEYLNLLTRMHFIKAVAPFVPLSNGMIKRIAERIEEVSLPAGAMIFKQGDIGDACYIVAEGAVAIEILSSNGSQKVLAELNANAVFGEAALMLDMPRNASARTILPTKLFKFDKQLFKEVTQQGEEVASALMEMQLHRCRPVKLPCINLYTQKKADGSEFTVLRNEQRGKYFQLSEQGLFIWNLLDGEASINDITLQFFLEYQVFNPEALSAYIMNLYESGFVQLDINDKLISKEKALPKWVRWISKVRDVMEHKVSFGNADTWVTRVYQQGAWLAYTRLARLIWLVISITGFASFAYFFSASINLLQASPNKWYLFFLASFLVALTIPFHELAHAFTTKYYNRKVYCFGLGWLWFGPFAFCDTSDMWLSPPRQRVIVDLVGLYLNIIFAGMAGLAVWLVFPAHPELTIVLVLFALNSYLLVIANLDPAIELDGYYALMDLLDKPNLRIAAIKWLSGYSKSNAVGLGWWQEIKSNSREAIYCVAVLFYVFVIGTLVPYIVFTYLLRGLFGVQNAWVTLILVLLAVIISGIGIYRDILKHG